MRASALFLAVAVLGCAGAPATVELRFDPTTTQGSAAAPVLGVARFVDRRPDSSRHTQSPRLQLRVQGLFRSGIAQTGDSSFAAPLVETLRDDAIATLQHSDLFSSVRPLEEAPAPFVLEATVEELVGTQWRSTELNLLRLGWFRREHDAAVGVVRVHYRLLHRGRLVFSERIETRRSRVGSGERGALVDAMAISNERLAAALWEQLHPPRTRTSRRLSVQVLDACGLGETAGRRLIADANRVLEREVSLLLEPRFRVWAPPPTDDADALLDAVAISAGRPDEIVLALVDLSGGPRAAFGAARLGLARQFGERALVDCGPDGRARALTVVHEVAHLFGGVHTSDRASIMCPVVEFDATFFDATNRRILRTTAARPMGRPLPSDMAEQVRAIYREAQLAPGKIDPADLGVALSALD
jgi:hypothetical protein